MLLSRYLPCLYKTKPCGGARGPSEPEYQGSIAPPISVTRITKCCHRFHAVLENFVLYVNCYHACVIFESSFSSCLGICSCLSREFDVLRLDTTSEINSAYQFYRVYAKEPSSKMYCIIFA